VIFDNSKGKCEDVNIERLNHRSHNFTIQLIVILLRFSQNRVKLSRI